jgi:hypothetical protein
MKLKMVEGCMCDSLTVDGIEEIEMTDEKRQETINKIMESLEPKDLNYLLQWYLPIFGDYECDNTPCECCGDVVTKYSLDI